MSKRTLLLLALLIATVPAFAAPWQIKLTVLRVAAGEHALDSRFMSEANLHALVAAGKAQVLDTLSGHTATDMESTIFAGKKIPMGFVNPRAGGYQVQYVDAGLKAIVKVHTDTSGKLLVEAKTEKTELRIPAPAGCPIFRVCRSIRRFCWTPARWPSSPAPPGTSPARSSWRGRASPSPTTTS